jgi:hypothetical protein
MRSTWVILTATLLLLGGAPTASAKASAHKLSGEVTSIDAAARTLSVSTHPKSAHPEAMKFSLASDAKVMAGPKAEELGHLKVGDPVTVTYVTHGTSHTATRIELSRSSSTAPGK